MTSETSIRSRSLVLTLLIHGLLLLALFFFMIHIPIPPFPEAAGGNGGVLVNIGYVESAAGDVQPISENELADAKPVKTQTTAEEENIATQDNEEVAVIHKEKKDHKKTKVLPVKDIKEEVKKEEKKIEVPVRVADAASLYKGKSNHSSSQGTAASGQGDQGDKNGDPNSNQYGKNGNGSGNGNGNGNGNGTGDGNGTGPGRGSGVSFSLLGRKIIQKPVIQDKSQETGTVVVEITVDKFGKVTKATPGARGTTTTNALLYTLAKQSAYTAKFNASPDAAEEQKGTITFVFTVQ